MRLRTTFAESWPPASSRGSIISATRVKLNPNYTLAMLQLGKTYYDNHEYESASLWFSRVPKTDPVAGEANFLLGMSEFYRGNFDKAFAAFSYLSTRLPLTEVYNNLGVVEARRGRRASAVEYFSKAVNADPNDADYRFNLAVALFKNGDSAGAARQLQEELQQRPSDGEAKALLDMINRGVPRRRRRPECRSVGQCFAAAEPAAHSHGAHQAQL